MDLYLVGPDNERVMQYVTSGPIKSNMLFSYLTGKRATARYSDIIAPKKLLVDSGAFTAWTKGIELSIDDYIQWINENDDHIHIVAQLDVIPGVIHKGHTVNEAQESAEETWQNFLYMHERINSKEKLMYIFHVGENMEFLKQALEWRDKGGRAVSYIGLGGMVGRKTNARISFLNAVFKVISESSNKSVQTHAFGVTSPMLLARYPLTSADSATWIHTGANGKIMSPLGELYISTQRINRHEHYSYLPIQDQHAIAQFVEQYGFTLEQLSTSRDARVMFNAHYLTKLVEGITYTPALTQYTLF